MFRHPFFLVVVFCLSAGIAAAAETVKIGVYLPITGGNAVGGQLELDGVNLAHKQYPEVDGKKIELVVVDNKSDKVEAANAVKRLIEREKVCAIIGTYGSSLAMAGGEVAEKAGVPMVGTSCTNPLVTQGKKYVFRVCFIDPFQGAGAANFAFTELKAKTAAMLIEVTEDYSVGLGNFFKQNFVKLGGEVVSVMNYQKGDQDFTAQLTEIISKNPAISPRTSPRARLSCVRRASSERRSASSAATLWTTPRWSRSAETRSKASATPPSPIRRICLRSS